MPPSTQIASDRRASFAFSHLRSGLPPWREVAVLLPLFGLLGQNLHAVQSEPVPAPAAGPAIYKAQIEPLLSQYCYRCHGDGKHKGGLALDSYADEAQVLKDRKTWEKVLHHVRTREMPPENKPQPSQTERDVITGWIELEVFQCDCKHPDPGRVTIRRLNRNEYNNTIRDLVGVEFHPADDFPADDVGYGFDNIGDVLSMPPVLMERYLAAAQKIMGAAIVTDRQVDGPVQKFEAEKLPSTAVGGPYGERFMALNREGEISTPVRIAADGDYVLRARAFGQQAGAELPKLEFRLDGNAVGAVDVGALENGPEVYQIKLKLTAGTKKLAAAYINNFVDPKNPNPDRRDRNLFIDYLEVVGPAGLRPLPDSHRRILFAKVEQGKELKAARADIERFATRAFRRPVSQAELDRLLKLFEMTQRDGVSFEEGVQVALEAVLVSPYFLFRGELQPEPNNPQATFPINEYDLASRLSYFLWSSMPDEELFEQAAKGTLRANLAAEVHRMLEDPKSQALVANFLEQWLQIRNLDVVAPDKKMFPQFDDELRAAMQKETELFLTHLARDDKSLLDLVGADYTYVNERLARFYGIPNVTGSEFRRVSLDGTHRKGILTQASILTITSNPTRTSPVKRGKWVLENILGAPPPPPPPNVPQLKEDKQAVLSGSLRQRMEQHRADPTCASCHERMDPIGFGFENFNAIGGWRDKDGEFPIDPSGKLMGGDEFNGPGDLTDLLLDSKKEELMRCIVEKTLTYALGRGLEYYDKCAVDEVCDAVAADHYKFSSLIEHVVKSVPFLMRRGEGERLAQANP